MLWRLATWSWQLMLGLCWLWYMPATSAAFVRWVSYLSVISSTCMCIWYLAKAYRHRLWRRRKSVRPSQEIRTERRRIAQSLHDVLGSQLVYALSLCINKPDPVLQQTLEQGLLNLRLIVDSMDGQDDILPMCMARFRHRVQPVLDRRGILLHWHVCDDDTLQSSDHLPRGQIAQNILAILQEAISNILQHAHAREIWITLHRHNPACTKNASQRGHLRVEDNGCGIPTCGQAGMGLANMRQRAHAIGGQLQISPRAGGGTCLHLSW